MVDEVVVVFTLNIHIKYVDWPPCVTTFYLYDRSMEGRALCKLRSRFLVAASGSLRLDTDRAPHLGAFEAWSNLLE